jgi:hypothetical protein
MLQAAMINVVYSMSNMTPESGLQLDSLKWECSEVTG